MGNTQPSGLTCRFILFRNEFNHCSGFHVTAKPKSRFQSPMVRQGGWFQFVRVTDESRMNSAFLEATPLIIPPRSGIVEAKCMNVSRLSKYIVQMFPRRVRPPHPAGCWKQFPSVTAEGLRNSEKALPWPSSCRHPAIKHQQPHTHPDRNSHFF